jgi:NAD-dependent SIR2 family protein deacetylase
LKRAVKTFRDENGKFQRGGEDAQALFYREAQEDETLREKFNKMVDKFVLEATKAEPTSYHDYLVDLNLEGRILRIHTFNIDDLHIRHPAMKTKTPLNSPYPIVIRRHGSAFHASCDNDDCKARVAYDRQKHGLYADKPVCPVCHIGILRPEIWLYWDFDGKYTYDREEIEKVEAEDLEKNIGMFLCVGTCANGLIEVAIRKACRRARKSGGFSIWVNPQRPPDQLRKYFNHEILGTADGFATVFSKALKHNSHSLVSATHMIETLESAPPAEEPLAVSCASRFSLASSLDGISDQERQKRDSRIQVEKGRAEFTQDDIDLAILKAAARERLLSASG